MTSSLDSRIVNDGWQEVNPVLISGLEEALKIVRRSKVQSTGVKIEVPEGIAKFKLAKRPSTVVNLSDLTIYFIKVPGKSDVGGFYSIERFIVYENNNERNYPVKCELREFVDKKRDRSVWCIRLTGGSGYRVNIDRHNRNRVYLSGRSL